MSAKITVIVYILICFEVGILLLILPWTQYWDDNFFLFFISGKLNAPGLASFLTSGWVRGAVTGLGVINILAGLLDIFKFRESVRSLTTLEEPQNRTNERESPGPASINLPDQQSPRVPPQA